VRIVRFDRAVERDRCPPGMGRVEEGAHQLISDLIDNRTSAALDHLPHELEAFDEDLSGAFVPEFGE
jgi:hypothetical protein